jgi:hypothetical protein
VCTDPVHRAHVLRDLNRWMWVLVKPIEQAWVIVFHFVFQAAGISVTRANVVKPLGVVQ